METINHLGSVASIVGAMVSCYAAYKAYKIKNIIVGRFHLHKMTELKVMAKSTISHIEKICVSQEKQRGIRIDDIISSLSQFHSELNENKDLLKEYGIKDYQTIIDVIVSTLQKLRSNANKTELRSIGDEVLLNLHLVVSELSRVNRSKIEKQ